MNLYDLFRHPDISLPMKWDSCSSFERFLSKRFAKFLKLLEHLDSGPIADKVINTRECGKIKKLCNCIKTSIRHTQHGYPHEAYTVLQNGIRQVSTELGKLPTSCTPRDLKWMYRIRVTNFSKIKKEELFHIPFELRHKVASQRYSIPGLPCLYLSGSLLTCWEEMGRPPFHKIQAAAFYTTTKLKILNFVRRPVDLCTLLNPDGTSKGDNPKRRSLSWDEYIYSYLTLWPLIASCSIVVKHKDAPYKPEYIIPQMVLQWVAKEKDVDGICYFSTHVNAASGATGFNCNYVFPAQKVVVKGHCPELIDAFKMTQPQAWQLLEAINVSDKTPSYARSNHNHEFVDGMQESYDKTKFGIVQAKLNKLLFSRIPKSNASQ